MDTDPALHQHYRNLQPHIQPSLQSQHTQHTQHHPQHFQHQQQHQQQHQNHHPQHGQQHQQHAPQHGQHSPHQQYALQNGLDLSSLVNEEYHHDPREYNQDPRLHSHASSVQAQALLKGVDAPFYHQQSHSPFEGQHGGQHRHMQHEHQASPHTPDQQLQQPQQTHPNLRPYPPQFMHAEGQHNGMSVDGQEGVFQSSPTLDAHNEQRHTAIAPNGPIPQAEEKKEEEGRVGQAGIGQQAAFGQPPPPLVPNPPNLEAWRQRLFDVNEMITLSKEEYHTYFPHIDNVYSHRSTQKYKRKPFVSHYWDCRLKGRPPGTPKSDDPGKKKRKRTARERDLCDVKIKITEFFEGAGPLAGGGGGEVEGGNGGMGQMGGEGQQHEQCADGQQLLGPQHPDGDQNNPQFLPNSQLPSSQPPNHPFRQPASNSHPQKLLPFQLPRPHPGLHGARYFTIQRVNGNGGNGKGDGVAGPHKHTLADSDKVKKNSVLRWMVREGKGVRKAIGALRGGGMAGNIKRATGPALDTIKKHSRALPKDNEKGVMLLGDCTDIETQRVWIALEVLRIPYQYVETSSNSIISGAGEVRWEAPAIRKGDWTIGGAVLGVILEYLNEVAEREPFSVTATAENGGGSGNGSAGLTKRGTGAAGMAGRKGAARTASLPIPDVSLPGNAPQNGRQESAEIEAVIPWAGATGPAPATKGLLPGNPADRAYARHWAHFVSSTIIPAYAAYLRSTSTIQTDVTQQPVVPAPIYEALKDSIVRLIAAAHPVGPFFGGKEVGLVDVVFAPVVLRLRWLLMARGWRAAEPGTRWAQWVQAIEDHPSVTATCCDAQSYEDAWMDQKSNLDESEAKRAVELENRHSGGDSI